MSPPHLHTLRVYYEDTDFSGVVYHASYLRFLERGRTELLRDIGVHQHALHGTAAPVAFAVRAMTIDFLKPALMDDLLRVETRVRSVSGAQAELSQRVVRGEAVLVTALVKVVAVAQGRAVRLPAFLRAAFETLARDQ
jgi:acyl-CoA thioester hydrolase